MKKDKVIKYLGCISILCFMSICIFRIFIDETHTNSINPLLLLIGFLIINHIKMTKKESDVKNLIIADFFTIIILLFVITCSF